MNKSINKDVISNRTRLNRKSAIEIILCGGVAENKSIKNIIDSAKEQISDCNLFKNIIAKSSLNFEEICDFLSVYKKGIIPVIIACEIKRYIDFVVIKKQGTEMPISSSLIEDIDKTPSIYTLDIVEDNCFCKYKSIFYSKGEGNNLFTCIMEGMQSWFFGLDKYTLEISKEYLGSGRYENLPTETIEFKNSLRVMPKEPYWYLSNKLPSIFGNDVYEKLLFQKNKIENTVKRLIEILKNDIQTVFHEKLVTWYKKLPKTVTTKIFRDGEEYFLELCRSDINEEEKIKKIAKHLVGIAINDWNENTPSLFFEKLKEIKESIETSENKKVNDGFVIKYINQGMEDHEKYIDIPSHIKSSTKSLFINDIKALLDDYRGSIKYADKISLLFQVLLEGKI